MTYHWCDNEQCEHHRACTPSQYYQPYFQTYDQPVYKAFKLDLNSPMKDEKTTILRVHRHRFISSSKGTEYFLCDACAAVIESSDSKFDPDLTI